MTELRSNFQPLSKQESISLHIHAHKDDCCCFLGCLSSLHLCISLPFSPLTGLLSLMSFKYFLLSRQRGEHVYFMFFCKQCKLLLENFPCFLRAAAGKTRCVFPVQNFDMRGLHRAMQAGHFLNSPVLSCVVIDFPLPFFFLLSPLFSLLLSSSFLFFPLFSGEDQDRVFFILL